MPSVAAGDSDVTAEGTGAESASAETRGTAPAKRSRLVATLARWAFAIILIGAAVNLALAWQSIRSGAADAIGAVSPLWLAVAALLGVLPWAFTALRSSLWARFLGTPITAKAALRVGVGTELGSSISPKAIGGGPIKVGLLIESGVRPGRAASMLLLDNMTDAVFFTTIAPAIAFLSARWNVPEVQEILGRVVQRAAAVAPWIGGGLALVATAVWLRGVWRRRSRDKDTGGPGRVRTALAAIRHDFLSAYVLVGTHGKLRFLVAVVLTTGLWLARCSVATAVLYGLGAEVDPILFFLLQWVVFMLMVFVPTPGAALGAEASFAAVVDGFVAEGILGIVTAGWRFFSFYFPLLVGLALMPLLTPSRRASPAE